MAFLVLILALVTVLCLRIIRRATRLPRDVGGSRCGACGYELAHNPAGITVCPECGTNVLDGGIVTPAMTLRKTSTMTSAVGALATLIVISAVLMHVVIDALPGNHYSQYFGNQKLAPSDYGRVRRLPGYATELSYQGCAFDRAAPDRGTVTVNILNGSSSAGATIDAPTGHLIRSDVPTKAPERGLTPDLLADMYRAVGLDPQAEEFSQDLIELLATADRARADPVGWRATVIRGPSRFSTQTGSYGSSGGGVGIRALGLYREGLAAVLFLSGVTAFAIGVWMIQKRRRHLRMTTVF